MATGGLASGHMGVEVRMQVSGHTQCTAIVIQSTLQVLPIRKLLQERNGHCVLSNDMLSGTWCHLLLFLFPSPPLEFPGCALGLIACGGSLCCRGLEQHIIKIGKSSSSGIASNVYFAIIAGMAKSIPDPETFAPRSRVYARVKSSLACLICRKHPQNCQ